MGKDIEEGEISDTASVEEITEEDFKEVVSIKEISEEDFNKREVVKVVKESSKPNSKGEVGNTRVWTVRDYCNKYGYSPSGLVSFAWSQGVQNKPLNEIMVMKEVDNHEESKRSSPSSSVASVNSVTRDYNSKTVVGVNDEKEEGELEEGEIDMDWEPPTERGSAVDLINCDDDDDHSLGLLEKRVNSVAEALESVVNAVHADKSFQGVGFKLQNTLESLKEVINENDDFPTKAALVQLSFSAVQALNSVFCSMSVDLKEQNKEILLRLLSLVKSFDPSLFSPDQLKEMAIMVSSLRSPNVILDAEADVKDKEIQAVDNSPVEPLMRNKAYMSLETPKPGIYGFRGRGSLRPLLDLHKDHDEDSLPSPTRETTTCVPAQRVLVVRDDMFKPGSLPGKVANDNKGPKIQFYETEAVKAVSSYQQKFGQGTFFSSDRLPSPTPSEESAKEGDNTFGEVSSSSAIHNSNISGSSTLGFTKVSSCSALDYTKLANPTILGQVIPSSQPMDISSMQGLATARNAAPVSSMSNPVIKASAKNRDPRIRCSNSDALDLDQRPVCPKVHNVPKVESVRGILSSRKKKNAEEPVLDGPALKRQRNGLGNSAVFRNVKTVSGSCCWLEDTDMAGPQIPKRNQLVGNADSNPLKGENGATCPTTSSVRTNVVVGGNEHLPLIVPTTTASLPAFFKHSAVNPTMLMTILKISQQLGLATEAQQNITDTLTNTSHPLSLNSITGAVPLITVPTSAPSGILTKPMGTLQGPSQIAPADESGKVRMKPRDPRRVLHGSTLQRNGRPEQFKTNGPSIPSTQASKDNLDPQKQQGQAEAKLLHSQSVPTLDIAGMFTKNLKNIADIMSVSQALTSQPIVSQNLPIQPVQNKLDKTDVKAVISKPDDQLTGTASAPEVGPMGPISQNTWGDVEHLFEGYDDKQKAAIQRERVKRLEEQKKMFAARKLCLVLDLDHTLLNSAKFHEVDPVHHEILRKKEEQERDKPLRHLFHLPHMGMWTKLRPGIWTFLERASKLFELHVYTMGNKVYATEMAKVLDPKGVLFNGRVISKGDDGDPVDGDERVPKSKDLEGVLGMESSVVIIDDSIRVWPHNKLNLIVVERYTYFPCSRRQFGLLGPSLLEIDHDERPDEGTLASSLGVIERIHQNFFSHQSFDDVDVRNILAAEQRKILVGCHILFSRVFPVGEANPHLHPLWQTAEQFGAACTKQIDDQVTHVVANSIGTDKVNWATSTGRFVVHPGWVEASALLYRRANEQDFAIKP